MLPDGRELVHKVSLENRPSTFVIEPEVTRALAYWIYFNDDRAYAGNGD